MLNGHTRNLSMPHEKRLSRTAVVEALRAEGCSVAVLDSSFCWGLLLVGRAGLNSIIRVMDKPLCQEEKDFHVAWRGATIKLVTTMEEAFEVVGLLPD
jgi:hypothetical protein